MRRGGGQVTRMGRCASILGITFKIRKLIKKKISFYLRGEGGDPAKSKSFEALSCASKCLGFLMEIGSVNWELPKPYSKYTAEGRHQR